MVRRGERSRQGRRVRGASWWRERHQLQREGGANETYPLHFTRQAVEAAEQRQRTLPAGFPATTAPAPEQPVTR